MLILNWRLGVGIWRLGVWITYYIKASVTKLNKAKCFFRGIVCNVVVLIKIYRTIILPLVLYGCETLSLTLREERRLRVFKNRVRTETGGRHL
jgi:hypothetical protein